MEDHREIVRYKRKLHTGWEFTVKCELLKGVENYIVESHSRPGILEAIRSVGNNIEQAMLQVRINACRHLLIRLEETNQDHFRSEMNSRIASWDLIGLDALLDTLESILSDEPALD